MVDTTRPTGRFGRVIEISPAVGFYSVYAEHHIWKNAQGAEVQTVTTVLPLACWALVEYKGGDREVVGMTGAARRLSNDQINARHLGYTHASLLDRVDETFGQQARALLGIETEPQSTEQPSSSPNGSYTLMTLSETIQALDTPEHPTDDE